MRSGSNKVDVEEFGLSRSVREGFEDWVFFVLSLILPTRTRFSVLKSHGTMFRHVLILLWITNNSIS